MIPVTAEPGLDESADPETLIVANLPAIDETIRHLNSLGDALERTGRGLRGIEVGQWSGEAADAFRARFDESPGRWFAGADAFADAATAFDAFRRTVQRSRAEATRAAELHRAGRQASGAAVQAHDSAVADVNAQLAAGGSAPRPLPEFTDPGVPMMEQAARILEAARRERDTAGSHAAQVVQASAATAPEPPTGWERAAADAADRLAEGDRYMSGLGEGVVGLAEAAEALNPTSPANILHPASYVENVNSMAAAAVSTAVHPAEFVKGVTGTGWGSDPFGAIGRLAPNLAVSAVSGGPGGIAGALGRGAVKAGRVGPHPRRPSGPTPAVPADVGGGQPQAADRPPPKTEDSPDLPARATIRPEFVGEERGESPRWGRSAFVRYFDEDEREEARLTAHDGVLYDDEGRPFQSELGGSWWSRGQERSIFVMDGKGNLFVSNDQEPGVTHHSSILAGAPVAGAGEIGVVDGKVEFLSDQSGHYMPPAVCLDQVTNYLRKEGVDVDAADVERHGR